MDRKLSRPAAPAATLLTLEDEQTLFARLQSSHDNAAKDRLARAHMGLVIREAKKLGRYGVSFEDLICEGNMGLVEAINNFDPTKGARLAGYAVHYIRGNMLAFIVRNRSIITVPNSPHNKRVFFKLRAAARRIENDHDGTLPAGAVTMLAQSLDVTESTIKAIRDRMEGDASSDDPTIIYDLASGDPNPEEILIASENESNLARFLSDALARLKPRERKIIAQRHLAEDTPFFKDLASDYGITPQRLQQIEKAGMKKLKQLLEREDVFG